MMDSDAVESKVTHQFVSLNSANNVFELSKNLRNPHSHLNYLYLRSQLVKMVLFEATQLSGLVLNGR